jgi:hypothetical protein
VNHLNEAAPGSADPTASLAFPRAIIRANGRWPARIALLVALLLPELALRSGIFERYYPAFWLEQAYPSLVHFWSLLGALPFSVALWFVLPATILLFVLALLSGWRAGWSMSFYRLLLLLCVLKAWHTLNWGLNYARMPLRHNLELAGTADEAAQVELFRYLAGVLQETESAVPDGRAALESATAALNELSAGFGLAAHLSPALRTAPGGLLLLGGVSGFIFPLTLEPHVDAALPPYQQVSIGIHELAHVAGIANEGDATLLAALAGLRAADPFARYSTALLHVYSVPLPREQRDELLQLIPVSARREARAASSEQSELRSPWYSEFQDRILDLYLKWQGTAGTADYGNGTRQLALAYRQGWF